jgi:hypothetical protein
MKILSILPWNSFGKLKAFKIFHTRSSMYPTHTHFARAGVIRSSSWKNKVAYVCEVKRFRKEKVVLFGIAYSLKAAKDKVDEFLRQNNVRIKTRKQIERLQVMK